MSPERVDDAFEVMRLMAEDEPPVSDSMEQDNEALRRTLRDFGRLRQDGILARVDGAPAGFALFERQTPEMLVIHFERARRDFKGLYQLVNRAAAEAAVRAGFSFLNREEDLGDPGLRQSKASYDPIRRDDRAGPLPRRASVRRPGQATASPLAPPPPPPSPPLCPRFRRRTSAIRSLVAWSLGSPAIATRMPSSRCAPARPAERLGPVVGPLGVHGGADRRSVGARWLVEPESPVDARSAATTSAARRAGSAGARPPCSAAPTASSLSATNSTSPARRASAR